MLTKKCRCGKTEKNFKFDIGPFFIDDCCIDAGYDESGVYQGEGQDPSLRENSQSNEDKNSDTTELTQSVDQANTEETKTEDLPAPAKRRNRKNQNSQES